jgi:Fe-S cluster biosynthesis and repair protein YggX
MKFENTEVWGFKHALRGMRNPMNSWDKSDSDYYDNIYDANSNSYVRRFVIGENDMKLAQSLIKAGSEHRKFMRQIFVSVDITAPLYWWKEFDTYKVGTVANSTSTMHKLASTPITMDCFEMDDFNKDLDFFYDSGREVYKSYWKRQIEWLEGMRLTYLDSKDKRHWNELIRALPESWLQKRTITMNYENVLNMIHQRRNHKLTEWSESFINWAKSLPYADELLFIKKEVKE